MLYDRRFVRMQMIFGVTAAVGTQPQFTADDAERRRAGSGGQLGQQMWTVSDDAFASSQIAVKRQGLGEIVPVTNR